MAKRNPHLVLAVDFADAGSGAGADAMFFFQAKVAVEEVRFSRDVPPLIYANAMETNGF